MKGSDEGLRTEGGRAGGAGGRGRGGGGGGEVGVGPCCFESQGSGFAFRPDVGFKGLVGSSSAAGVHLVRLAVDPAYILTYAAPKPETLNAKAPKS